MEHVPSVKKDFLRPLVRMYVWLVVANGLAFHPWKLPLKDGFH